MSYKDNRYHKTDLYVLSTIKTLKDGKPLTGYFWREKWVDGETITAMSYRAALRKARTRGFQLVPWIESKAYKTLVNDTVEQKAEIKDVEKATKTVFENLKKAAGVDTGKEKKTKLRSRKASKK